MLPDLPGTLIAIVVLALVGLAPGWGAAYWFDLLAFRSRFITYKIAIALSASLAISPILLVVLVRWTNLRVGAIAMLVLDLIALAAIVHSMRARRRGGKGQRITRARRRLITFTAIVAFIWMFVALAWLLDVIVGNGLYMSVPWTDHTKRVAWIDAIVRTGVPPNDPSTHPGRPVKMFYYYGWYAWAATGQTLGLGLVRPLHMLIGGVVWSGWACIASLGLAVQYLGGVSRRNLRKSWIIATLLLTVTGLDIVPGIVRFVRMFGAEDVSGAPRTVEWWNEQVTGFIDMLLWVPHHVAALVVGILVLSVWQSRGQQGRARTIAIVAMGVALASLATLSLYVALPLGFFFVGYSIVCLARGQSRDTAALACAAGLAIVLAAQYLYDLITAPGASAGIALNVREFSPISKPLAGRGVSPAIVHLVNFLLLPVNYLFELGFFAVAGIVYWFWRRNDRRPADRFACGLFWASLLTATFLRSSISANDLGWRSIMFAQIVLLVWSIQPAIAMWDGLRGAESISAESESLLDRFGRTISVLLLLCVLGLSATLYDLFLLRFSFGIWPERQTVPERALAVRQAHEWVRQHTPPDAIVQHNINLALDIFALHYGNRQVLVPDTQKLNVQGIDAAAYDKLSNAIYAQFMLPNPPRDVHDFFTKYDVHALVVKETDANWPRKDSWFWTTPAAYENSHTRVILVKDLLATPSR